MNIAFLSINSDPLIPTIDSDGGAVTVRNYALELGKIGHSVDIFTSKIIDSKINDYLKIKYIAQKENILFLSNNVKIIRKTLKDRNLDFTDNELLSPDFLKIKKSFLFADSFGEELLNYDVICVFHPLNIFGLIQQNKIPLEKTILFPMLLADDYSKFIYISKLYKKFEKESLILSKFISSPSNQEKETLIKMGINKNKIIIIPRGFDKNVFRHKLHTIKNKESIDIISVGAVKPQKQQQILVNVLKKINTDKLKVKIHIIGEDSNFHNIEYRKYCVNFKNQIKKYNLWNNFKFYGALNPTDTYKIINKCDIAIFPSISESFGKAPLETIASGLPTIISNSVSAYKEFAKNETNSVMVRPVVQDYCNVINRIIYDKVLYSKLSKNGIYLSDKLNWTSVSNILNDFLIKFDVTK